MSADQNIGIQPMNQVGKHGLLHSNMFIKQLIARKPMNQLQAEIETQNELRRTLNWYQLTAIGLGAMIGGGITILSGQVAANFAGPSVIISFIITGIIAILTALSFSELAAMMSHSGAAYTYTYAALGEYLAWFIGWNYALLYQFSVLPLIVVWSEYVVHFINLLSHHNVTSSVLGAPFAWNNTVPSFYNTGQVINLPAIAITIAVTLLLVTGIRPTAMVNLILVIIKISVLFIFIFACCKYVDLNNYKPFLPKNEGSLREYGITGMLIACGPVFGAYVGFDSILTVAQEVRPPTARPIAFATIGSVFISSLIYIGMCTVMIGLVPYKLLNSPNPLSRAIEATPYGLWLKIVMNLGTIFALTTVILTKLLSQNRVFYAMANDGLLPPFLTRIRSHIPWISTIVSGVLCAVISGIFPADIIGGTASLSALVIYFFVHIEVIVMRFTHANMPRTFQVPFGPWLIPILGSLLCLFLLACTWSVVVYGFLVWTAIGQIFYFSYGFWHSKRRPQTQANSVKSSVKYLSTVEAMMIELKHTVPEVDEHYTEEFSVY